MTGTVSAEKSRRGRGKDRKPRKRRATPPTYNELKLLAHIENHYAEHGVHSTREGMAKAMGVSAAGSIANRLRGLSKKGFLTFAPRSLGGMRVTRMDVIRIIGSGRLPGEKTRRVLGQLTDTASKIFAQRPDLLVVIDEAPRVAPAHAGECVGVLTEAPSEAGAWIVRLRKTGMCLERRMGTGKSETRDDSFVGVAVCALRTQAFDDERTQRNTDEE